MKNTKVYNESKPYKTFNPKKVRLAVNKTNLGVNNKTNYLAEQARRLSRSSNYRNRCH